MLHLLCRMMSNNLRKEMFFLSMRTINNDESDAEKILTTFL